MCAGYYWVIVLIAMSMAFGVILGRSQSNIDTNTNSANNIRKCLQIHLNCADNPEKTLDFAIEESFDNASKMSEMRFKSSQESNSITSSCKSSNSSSHNIGPDHQNEFKDLTEFLDDGHYATKFKSIKILGVGGFGSVHLVKHKLDRQLYAIKIVNFKLAPYETIRNHKFFAEVNAIKQLQSKYVVRYITCWAETLMHPNSMNESLSDESYSQEGSDSSKPRITDGNFKQLSLYIQMEFCNGLNLREFMDKNDYLVDRRQNLIFFRMMLKGVKHIHDRAIIHRDLKPANIFINGKDNIKIGDFNLARIITAPSLSVSDFDTDLLRSSLTSNIGTPLYSAPEQENSTTYDNKVDIFSLGIVLFELSYKFETYQERYQILREIRQSHKLPAAFMREFPIESHLILEMTNPDPTLRQDAVSILNSKLLQSWEKSL